jgi:hypothetical protein
LKALRLDEWNVRIAVETLALRWIVRVDVPHKLTLHSKLAFILMHACVRLVVCLSTLCGQLLPGRTLLEIIQQFVIEDAFDNGA